MGLLSTGSSTSSISNNINSGSSSSGTSITSSSLHQMLLLSSRISISMDLGTSLPLMRLRRTSTLPGTSSQRCW